MSEGRVSARYLVRLLPRACRLEVELTLENVPTGAPLELAVPTWVPGAYAFMRYGRDLFEVRAFDGAGGALQVRRSGWAGWSVEKPTSTVRVTYLAHGFDPAWGELIGVVTHTQAVLLGTHYLHAPKHPGPCTVKYELPAGWKLHHPAGARALGGSAFSYPNYLALFDTPVVMGEYELTTRSLHGKDFHFAFLDRGVGFETEAEKFVDSLIKVAEACHAVFGSFPFDHYTFVFSFDPRFHWGLEHANATMIGLGEAALFDKDERARAVRVSAHELFHAWNVCRLKPFPFGQLDHAGGSFTEGLWIAEGFTRYYEFLLQVRAEELSPEAFFSNIVNYYRHLGAMPAYARTTLVDSSLATFLNHNKYPGSINNTIDYYDHGMLVAFDLDAAMRLEGKTLDRAFRGFYEAFVEKPGGYTQQDVLGHFAREGHAFANLIEKETQTPGALSVEEKLTALGFTVAREEVRYIGLVLDANAGPAIANVLDDGPAAHSGIAPGDELARVAGFPFKLSALKYLIANQKTLEVEVKRGNRFFTFQLATAPRSQIASLEWSGTMEQAERIRTWLGRSDFVLEAGRKIPLTSFENFHGIQAVI